MRDETDVFVKSTEVVSRIVAGEAILVPVCRDVTDLRSVYVVNDVGEAVWRFIDGARTAEDIAQCVAGEFEVELDVVRGDVQAFLAQLATLKLVAVAASEPP